MKLIKIFSLMLCLVLVCPLLFACGGDYTKLSFKSTLSYDYLKTLDGTPVTINGYIATSSPVDGSFIFLMNMPYQSCPFCVPNTTELSNTIEVYPKGSSRFEYTASAVTVKGVLEVAPSVDQFFVDRYGYKFNFKIVNAEYDILKSEDMNADFAVWEKFANSGVIDELYKMYDYLDFVCKWNDYFIDNRTDDKGNVIKGFYFNASDAKSYITKGALSYGSEEGYFDDLISKVEAIDKTAFSQLVDNIRQAEALAKVAVNKLNNGEYSTTTDKPTYIEKFDTYDYIYTIHGGEELKNQLNNIYAGFENWLGSWEL